MVFPCPKISLKVKNFQNLFSHPRQRQVRVSTMRTYLQKKARILFPFNLSTFYLILPAVTLIGQELYDQLSSVALKLYSTAAEYALTRGLILVDTKFEFGLIPDEQDNSKKKLILIDEALTPDSSRYWPLESYKAGGTQPSFDKQFLRDWLVQSGFKKGLESGPVGHEGEGWTIEENVVEGTRQRYAEAIRLLTA